MDFKGENSSGQQRSTALPWTRLTVKNTKLMPCQNISKILFEILRQYIPTIQCVHIICEYSHGSTCSLHADTDMLETLVKKYTMPAIMRRVASTWDVVKTNSPTSNIEKIIYGIFMAEIGDSICTAMRPAPQVNAYGNESREECAIICMEDACIKYARLIARTCEETDTRILLTRHIAQIIIDTFDQNPRIGYLLITIPSHRMFKHLVRSIPTLGIHFKIDEIHTELEENKSVDSPMVHVPILDSVLNSQKIAFKLFSSIFDPQVKLDGIHSHSTCIAWAPASKK